MNRSLLRWETILFAAAFLIGLILRLVSIAQLPLSEPEAVLALQAAGVAAGEDVLLAPHPAYLSLTALLMFLTGPSDWTARFWPALAGSLLILTPLFFRRWIGSLPAVLLAWGLAIDPGLLIAARTAGGPTIAMLGLVAAAGYYVNGKFRHSGIAAGLALLGGPAIWPGLLSGGGALLLSRALIKRAVPVSSRFARPPAAAFGSFFAALAATIVLAGTLFFTMPRGLSAMTGSLVAYLGGWAKFGMPIVPFLVTLVAYEFFPLLLGMGGLVYGLRRSSALARFCGLWWLLALLLALIYPARQPVDFTWTILAFGVLAAWQAARVLAVSAPDRLPVLGQALLCAMLFAFFSAAVLSLVNNWTSVSLVETGVRAGGALALIIASVGLVGWGWSKGIALRGFSLGLLLVVLLYAVSTGWYSAALSARANREAWAVGQPLPDHRLLLQTLTDIRGWGNENDGSEYQLVVAGVPSSALRWALRNDPNVQFVDQLPAGTSPALVITPDQPNLSLAAAYRGQSFVLDEEVSWVGLRPPEWARWLAFRVVPEETILRRRMILWARGNVFPGGTLESQEDLPLEIVPAGDGGD